MTSTAPDPASSRTRATASPSQRSTRNRRSDESPDGPRPAAVQLGQEPGARGGVGRQCHPARAHGQRQRPAGTRLGKPGNAPAARGQSQSIADRRPSRHRPHLRGRGADDAVPGRVPGRPSETPNSGEESGPRRRLALWTETHRELRGDTTRSQRGGSTGASPSRGRWQSRP